jgi:hypothetical protein
MSTSDLTFFQFEADFVESLRCIPMQVRYKLDTCGIKLKLEHWHKFSPAEREQVVTHPCQTAADIAGYRETLQALVAKYFETPVKDLPIDPHPPWQQTAQVPPEVAAQAQQFDTIIPVTQWTALSPLERFALCKLSRPSHENRNFLPALYEFGLKESSEQP